MFPLPLNDKPYYNTDPIANMVSDSDIYDCYLEPVPGIGFVTRRRPGLIDFCDLGTGVQGDGIFWWDVANKCIAISGSKVFEVKQDGSFVDITGSPLMSGVPVTFAAGQDLDTTPWLYMANGNLVYTVDGSTTKTPITLQETIIDQSVDGLANDATTVSSLTIPLNSYSDNARQVLITNNYISDLSGINAIITGTDAYGDLLVESIALPTGKKNTYTAGHFKSITSFVLSATIYAHNGDQDSKGFADSVNGRNWIPIIPTAPDGFAHKVTITNPLSISHTSNSATLYGYDINGNEITEVLTLPGPFATVTSTLYYNVLSKVNPISPISVLHVLDIGYSAPTVTVYIDIGWTTSAFKESSGGTPNATHVAWIDGRFVANIPNSPRFVSTDTNPATGLMDNKFWASTINPFRNTMRGDNIKALLTCWEEIYVWGSEGLEVWQNDYSTPFTAMPSAAAEVGLEAPYSICRTENTLFALCVLDGKRVVVRLQGRAPNIVSEPIANILANMTTVSDAIGDLINVGGIPIYLLSFPSENQTWAYDHKNDAWVRWGTYTGDSDTRDQFIGHHSCFCRTWNKHLIQSRMDGKIYELSRSAYDDAGTMMVPYRRTGWIVPTSANTGTASDKRKRCDQLYIKCKPGLTDDIKLLVRHQDDGRNEWSPYTELTFKNNSVIRLTRQGTFRTRRYEFRFPDNIDTVLVSAEGTFMELKN